MSSEICVIIPAFNAEATIGDAVRSALAQPELRELRVIDDASSDATSEAAHDAAAGDTRLQVIRQTRNTGPAAARNIAIAESTAPYLSVLDADDYLLPGRFGRLALDGTADIVADNIVFVPESRPDLLCPESLPALPDHAASTLDLAGFIRGNLSLPGQPRGELGILKPVISRAFLDRHGLRYNAALRLGEDCDLYLRMFLDGARFRLQRDIGYVARVRRDSLSGRHRAEDLGNLLAAAEQLAPMVARDPKAAPLFRAYLTEIRARYLLRDFLDVKRRAGLAAALRHSARPLSNLVPVFGGVARDKLAALRKTEAPPLPDQRYLLPLEQEKGGP
ncbi:MULTISPECIES: glycosyltransferase family 2 protein [Thioclava]|uniref:glycosyltransferase family 2 protein n=1 Tax=Thioclava TaxID=285107 RepID=UPI000B54787A|nr:MULTISPECIES: glycosyltransferase family 2 protein [Thioclava]OWY15301.1 hypothetical protein B6V72_01530 [Thioclava sp. F34-6]WGT50030.1 glycosyltransferase family 2 protein [Thioclava nitratireducens]